MDFQRYNLLDHCLYPTYHYSYIGDFNAGTEIF